jgi:hypothetical protein
MLAFFSPGSPFLSLTSFQAARRLVGAAGLVLVLLLSAGCDSTGGLADDGDAAVTAEETAEAIALSTAENSGGTADDLATAAGLAASTLGTSRGGSPAIAAAFERGRDCSYDGNAEAYTCTFIVTGSRGRIDTLDIRREVDVQFFANGTPTRRARGADSLVYRVRSGAGQVKTPRIDNEHTVVASAWSFSRAGEGRWAVDLLSESAGRDVREVLSGPERERSREASVRKTDASGVVWQEGSGLVDGSLAGSYDAAVAITRADDSTVERSVDVSYQIVFSDGAAEITFTGSGERFNGQSFTFDPASGELQ